MKAMEKLSYSVYMDNYLILLLLLIIIIITIIIKIIMTPEQRGGKKDCYGCKDQLMINNVILAELKEEKEEEPVYSLD